MIREGEKQRVRSERDVGVEEALEMSKIEVWNLFLPNLNLKHFLENKVNIIIIFSGSGK